jgi:UDP-N-acetylmuramoyl-L-alanyl-D-glutamate--2,6-diaminopimelate ligase
MLRVASHTDDVGPGSIYVAIPGEKTDGAQFVVQAVEQGAKMIVVQEDSLLLEICQQPCMNKGVCFKVVPDAREALAHLSAEAYAFPAKRLKLLGVTGTDGKTTSAYLLYHLLKVAGKKVALLSGVENILDDKAGKASLTTPKPDFLHDFFHQCVQKDVEYVVMEVSAQAESFSRLNGLEFEGMIFTNLSQEHGEQYKTLEDYFATKCAILSKKKKDAPIVVHPSFWAQKVFDKFKDIVFVGYEKGADVQVTSLQESFEKQVFEIKIGTDWHQIESSLVGAYNLLNIAGAAALVFQLGISGDLIEKGLSTFKGISGRFERYQLRNGAWVVIDYAHTPQALESVLPVLKRYARELIVVTGAGGGKDIKKRAEMGKVAVQYADRIILTNVDPRHENTQKIMDDIERDLTERQKLVVVREPDRALAIKRACCEANAGDIVAILGKGHETTINMGAHIIQHNDSDTVRAL